MYQITLHTGTGTTEIEVGEHLSARLRNLDSEPILLIDEQVLGHYPELFTPYPCVPIPSGEPHKNIQTVEAVCRQLVEAEADRTSLIVGVGGGLATDVAGFVASTFLRGVSFGFISTTLLGQVDASIGGKNGVNLDGYKNMIGTIRQPRFIWCDLSLLHTLDQKEYVSGIAEVIKYGAIRDAGFLHYLKEEMGNLLGLDMEVLKKVVTTSASVKVDVVQNDEMESGLRRILNFGHTVGHAIERELKLMHGEAVAAGMVFAARLSHALGYLSPGEVDLIQEVVTRAGLPATFQADPQQIYDNIRKDKKRSGDALHFVLLEGLGNAIVQTIPLGDLKTMIHDLC